MSDYLNLEARRNIYELLKKNPGLHLSKIADVLNLRISHVEYHLLYLEKNQLITTLKEKGYKRYYIAGNEIGIKEKWILSLLRQEIPLRIVLILLNKSNATHGIILKEISVSPSTLSYHLKKLVKHGLIHSTIIQGEKLYSIVNEREIVQFVIKYKPYEILESFKDIWSYLNVE